MTTLTSKTCNPTIAHIIALITISIWGVTFIVTKLLLVDFKPIEILFFRFLLAYITLWAIYPRFMPWTTLKQEIMFAGAGICGVTLYFLFENIALTYTSASNVGIITALSPVITGLLAFLFLRTEKPNKFFFIGCLFSIFGVILIGINGSTLNLNPIGDGLAVVACCCWASYSILIKKIANYGHHTIHVTRRCFCYGLLFMLPVLPLFGFELNMARFTQPLNTFSILFLGIGASAICFASWNFVVKQLGAVKISTYIYLVPIITIITAIIILHEKFTVLAGLGSLMILIGLLVAERK